MGNLRLAIAALIFGSFACTLAQETGSLPEQAAPPALTRPPVGGPARERPAVDSMNRPDPNSPAQAGRNALWKYLDDIADKDTAARRVEMAKITTRAQAEARQQEVRAKVLALMGGGFVKTPLNAKVVGSTQLDGFRIEKVVYESQPKFYVTALFYVPDNVTNARGGKVPTAGAGQNSSGSFDSGRSAASARDDDVWWEVVNCRRL